VNFLPTPLAGAFVIDIDRLEDERGFFARSWCSDEAEALGLNPSFTQCNISFNRRRGTLRGLHYQVAPFAEAKLVRCTRGSAYDVIVDLRAASSTRFQWFGVTLSAENHRMVYVPEGFAHGFQTLEDGTELFYQMSEAYRPEAGRGLRWDDPALAINWPIAEALVSPRDKALPILELAPC
jgi:dTDP-4-dehydrorhamnose 3,5-epimerase